MDDDKTLRYGEAWSRTKAIRLVHDPVPMIQQWWVIAGVGPAPDLLPYSRGGEWRNVPIAKMDDNTPPSPG